MMVDGVAGHAELRGEAFDLKDSDVAWTLDSVPPEESIRLDNYFLAVGKALCLASNFEGNCKFVLQTLTIIGAIGTSSSSDSATELLRRLSENAPMLGETIRRIGTCSDIVPSDIEILRAAKDSRNYIAHEAAAMGPLSEVRPKFIEDQFARLLSHAAILATGEQLVAKWCFEICEKRPGPRDIEGRYAKRVQDWVGEQT